MGCDIHCFAEKYNKKHKIWKKVGSIFSVDDFEKEYFKIDKTDSPFSWRSYDMFSFFAGVRNRNHIKPIVLPRGLPNDISDEVKEMFEEWKSDSHTESFISLKELNNFNYDNEIIDLTFGEVIEENKITYRMFLGDWFFKHLSELNDIGKPDEVRIVFWFDN